MHNKPGRRSKNARIDLRPARRPGERARYVIRDIDSNGRRIEKSTGLFAEASRNDIDQALEDYLAEKRSQGFSGGNPAKVLIADLLAYYLKEKQDTVMRLDTFKRSVFMLDAWWKDSIVDDITPKRCKAYVSWRIGQGDARGSNKWKKKLPTKRELKSSTARNDLIVLKAAITYAYENRMLTHPVPVALPEPSRPRIRFLTTSEAARLLLGALGWDKHGKRHPKRINRHLARLILIGLYTGTRIDCILRLQWVENFQGGWVDLRRGMLHRKAPNEPDTNKKAPSAPLADAPKANKLWAHLRRWRRLTARYVIEHDGMNIKNNVVTAMEGACELAGLDRPPYHPDRISPHTFRHTCVSWMLASGKSPHQVGKYVGMTVQMVDRVYGHVTEHMQRETANTRRRYIR